MEIKFIDTSLIGYVSPKKWVGINDVALNSSLTALSDNDIDLSCKFGTNFLLRNSILSFRSESDRDNIVNQYKEFGIISIVSINSHDKNLFLENAKWLRDAGIPFGVTIGCHPSDIEIVDSLVNNGINSIIHVNYSIPNHRLIINQSRAILLKYPKLTVIAGPSSCSAFMMQLMNTGVAGVIINENNGDNISNTLVARRLAYALRSNINIISHIDKPNGCDIVKLFVAGADSIICDTIISGYEYADKIIRDIKQQMISINAKNTEDAYNHGLFREI